MLSWNIQFELNQEEQSQNEWYVALFVVVYMEGSVVGF